MLNQVHHADASLFLKNIENDSIDTLITDPPYGYSFMNKDWDAKLISVDTWKECLRVLKPGSFAAIMSSPRQDVMARMIMNLQDAGFRTDFTSIYWTYASGFPKSANVSKLVDKRYKGTFITEKIKYFIEKKNITIDFLALKLNKKDAKKTLWDWLYDNHNPLEKDWVEIKKILNVSFEDEQEYEREIIGYKKHGDPTAWYANIPRNPDKLGELTRSATDKAQELDGSYAGFQPKPAVEVILMVMKPLSEKTYVDQALINGKGVTWLDDCRIPFQDDDRWERSTTHKQNIKGNKWNSATEVYTLPAQEANNKGRFPANLLVQDDILNDGKIRKSGNLETYHNFTSFKTRDIYGKYTRNEHQFKGDSGSYSRYFSLDKWFDTTFPFIITPKASSSERNKGLDKWISRPMDCLQGNKDGTFNKRTNHKPSENKNFHPTVKPLKLMSWLITLLSRKDDIVLDPFCGSGTTCIAAKLLNRKFIGIEINGEYAEIARQRINTS